MASTKPVLVVIHAAFMPPACYFKTTDKLRAIGFEVVFTEHPSLNGAKPPNSSLAEDTAVTQAAVHKIIDTGRTVAAIMHSYGGQVGTNALKGLGLKNRAAQGLEGGVSHLIYVSASMGPENTSMMDKVREMGHEDLMEMVYEMEEDKTMREKLPRLRFLDNYADEAEAQRFLGLLKDWNGQAIFDPIKSCAWRQIPTTYVHTTQDIVFPMAYQESFVEDVRKEGVAVATETIESGHMPFFTHPDEVVAIIRRIAES